MFLSIPHRLQGIFALLIVTLVWGTTFPAMKDLTAHFSAVWIILVRFAMAGLLLSPFLWRARWRDCLPGALLGATLFLCYMLQLEGLALTTSNRNAFVTGLNVLVVPLLGLLAGKAPERRIVIAIALAIAGLFALCWDGGAWGYGDNLALTGAFFFGVYVKLLEVLTRRASSLMVLTTVQILVVALCAAIWLVVWELPRHPVDWTVVASAMRSDVVNFLYLGLVATAAIISLQTWGQRHSSANEAAVIYAFEPACAAIAAYFWLGEMMTWRGLLGAALLIAGMIVSQWSSPGRRRKPLAG
ncbi:Permease of the drug/metabolite transporter (DMT) superfamily [Oxalobacteraceae bacterium IMCC9480]|nr:Permease of the drug/metabolite transporter (DMT) superfamily [Oxalobacteraceae bacterium IMCC9480]